MLDNKNIGGKIQSKIFFVEIESKYSKMISFGENKLKPQT